MMNWFQVRGGGELGDDQLNVEQKHLVLIFGSLFAIAMLLVMGVSAFFCGSNVVGLVDFGAALVLVANLLYLKTSQNYERAASCALLLAGLLFYYLFTSGGVNHTGHVWYFVFPLMGFFLLGAKKGARATALFFVATLVFFLVDHLLPFVNSYPGGFKVRFSMAFLVVAVYSYLAEKYREDALGRLSGSNLKLVGKVNELKEAQYSLQESEEKYRNLVERANDGIVIVQDYKLCYANPQMAKMLGYNLDEIIDKNFIDYLHPQEIDTVVDRHDARIRGEIFTSKYESVFKHRTGEECPVELNACQINYNRRPASLVVIRDISERKRIELEQVKARRAAEGANRAKSEFLANMSHELRTPLNHIIGFTDLMAQERAGSLNDTQKEYLQDVLTSGRHLLDLINEILDLSKIESGKMDMEHNQIQTESFFAGCINMIKHKAAKHRLKIETNIDKALPASFIADERKFKQVLYNLLANAVKFTLDGGVVTVTAKLLENDKYLQFEVKDNGIGIAAQDLQRIFAPFEQADGSSGRKFQGTGLGLSLSRQIIEMHGGTICAESAGPGQGSTFRFTLPLRTELPLSS